MNAYELEIIQATLHSQGELIKQQADRIAELEKRGKPVAWMSPDGKVSQTEGKLFYIPLYTTPQTKPLSDEEINEIKTLMEINYGCVPPLEFAWAIKERHGIK